MRSIRHTKKYVITYAEHLAGLTVYVYYAYFFISIFIQQSLMCTGAH